MLAYAVFGAVANFPIFPGDPSRMPSLVGEDIVQTTWFLEWTPWAILHGHNLFSTHLINYPLGVDLAQNTGIPILGILTAPITLLVSPVASMNLLRWIAFWLSAYAAFAVIKKWTSWTPAAFVGGLLYGFSPYMAAQGLLHLNLYFVPLPPVILYLIAEITIHQRRSAVRSGLLLGLACIAQFFISSEILATTLMMAGIGVFVLFFSCIHAVSGRIVHAATAFAVAGALLAIVTGYPVWLAFHGPQHYAGPAQGYNNVYNADLLGPIIPDSNQLLAPARISHIGSALVGGNTQENGSYLGIPLLIAMALVAVRYWRKLWPIFLAGLIITAFAFSLGPNLIVDGRVVALPFGLPFKKIEHLPGINNILPVRFSLYVILFASILIALGIDWYHDDLLHRRALVRSTKPARLRMSRVALGALGALTLASLLPNWPYPTFPLRLNPAVRSASLAIIPDQSVVLTYPYATAFADQAMLWQALDDMRFKILGSYALVPSPQGTASASPSVLQPEVVEATLVNSISPTPDPHLPADVATRKTVLASSVEVLGASAKRPRRALDGGVLGKVALLEPHQRGFILDVTNTVPVGVTISSSTSYVNIVHREKRSSLAALAPGTWVIVHGRVTGGTVNAALVEKLRTFLRANQVDDVVIDLGLRDSWTIGLWMRAAIGKATRAGHGGLIWTDVPARLAVTTG